MATMCDRPVRVKSGLHLFDATRPALQRSRVDHKEQGFERFVLAQQFGMEVYGPTILLGVLLMVLFTVNWSI
jgi:hypothetical protein